MVSEIKALASGTGTTRGVDASVADAVTEEILDDYGGNSRRALRKKPAPSSRSPARSISSQTDDHAYCIRNGHPMMSKITGTGCQLSALIAAYITANPEQPLGGRRRRRLRDGPLRRAGLCPPVAAGRERFLSELYHRRDLQPERRRLWKAVPNMKCDKKTMLLYAVTDRAWVGRQSLQEQVECALKGGATCIQLREKELSDAEFLQEALEMKKLCQAYHVPFIINDNVKVAVACGADGIHVGQQDMQAENVRALVGERMILGVSVHKRWSRRCWPSVTARIISASARFSTP